MAFVQSPALIALSATGAALLALLGVLNSVGQQRDATTARIGVDARIADANTVLRWIEQFTTACRAVMDAESPLEWSTSLAVVQVLRDQAPGGKLGPGLWAERVADDLFDAVRERVGELHLSGGGTLDVAGRAGPPRTPGPASPADDGGLSAEASVSEADPLSDESWSWLHRWRSWRARR